MTTVPGVPSTTPCGLGSAAGLAAGGATAGAVVGEGTAVAGTGVAVRVLVPALSHELTA
jgi:hypothetical protein